MLRFLSTIRRGLYHTLAAFPTPNMAAGPVQHQGLSGSELDIIDFGLAVRPGFEPGLKAPKARVLPLHHRTTKLAKSCETQPNQAIQLTPESIADAPPDARTGRDLSANFTQSLTVVIGSVRILPS